MEPLNTAPSSEKAPSPTPSWFNRTVVGAGITSALGDIAHESTTTILPGFLAVLGVPAAPAVLGLVEGLSDATSSFTKLGAGFFSDRLGYRKPIVLIGYSLTAGAQGLYALAYGWPLILLARMIAWFGRGIRGPLRDSILAESIPPEAASGRAFGFHRAADTLGAVVGPLLGAGLLAWLHEHSVGGDATTPFRTIFWISMIPGFLAVASFAILVREERRPANHSLQFWTTVRELPLAFRKYLVAVGLFGIGDFAPSLLIMAATQLLTPSVGVAHAAALAALLYLWRNVVYAVASFPVGAIADRFGHRRVLIAGYALGALTAAMTAVAFAIHSTSLPLLIVIFTLAGLYIAIEDALEGSMTADFTAPEVRGTAYGVLGTVNGLGDFLASAGLGLLWTTLSPAIAFTAAGLFMLVGTVAMSRDGR